MKNQREMLVQLPTRVIARRMEEEDAKVLRRSAVTPIDKYAQSVARAADWTIKEQPVMSLPRGLTDFLSLDLRDQGNALIEETRALNNQFVGESMTAVTALLVADYELHDLRDRVLKWTESAMREVVYRYRRRIQSDPFEAYMNLFNAFVRDIDTRIVHGDDRMYQRAWGPAIDCMAYIVIDACFMRTGYASLTIDGTPKHIPRLVGPIRANQQHREALGGLLNLFGVEPAQYLKEIVLTPLAQALAAEKFAESHADLRARFHNYLGDLLEAWPHLCASSRAWRYMFPIADTGCWAAFRFIASHGVGTFYVADSEEDLRRGLESNALRGIINIGLDGTLSINPHPWMTFDRVLGEIGALTVSVWLLAQVHSTVVDDYLKVSDNALKHVVAERSAVSHEPEVGPEHFAVDEIATYASWLNEARDGSEVTNIDSSNADTPSQASSSMSKSVLPQIRQSRFFKILRECGVEVVQGKGSEKKLLRPGAHPFRLGSHYGPNPTIPSFLACQILRRLEITREDWVLATQGISE